MTKTFRDRSNYHIEYSEWGNGSIYCVTFPAITTAKTLEEAEIIFRQWVTERQAEGIQLRRARLVRSRIVNTVCSRLSFPKEETASMS